MSNVKRVKKWWFSWDSDKIEQWIEEMEAQGWHLTAVTGNAIHFAFEKGEPRRMRYCVDYQSARNRDYIALCQDAGWELLYDKMGWYVWRMPYTDTRPELYSDVDSLMDRNKRLIAMMATLTFAQIPIIVALFSTLNRFPYIYLIYAALFAFFLFGIVRLNAANTRLRGRREDIS
ncbi:DUF2812 domain-containing protein [Cohnella nanjingensis]|uniref:DUF2812 domain-containing protein n=1 Tax=Cohnella nanjingensis TaxID=1387779 RepID=A0A7X0VF87_9BACL|nr:DUF2812 domain-containing protein [Cohnella nanjingensis]MBB6670359.1 DUF2812 domain-containing protein [Cohnella nanjingensis]